LAIAFVAVLPLAFGQAVFGQTILVDSPSMDGTQSQSASWRYAAEDNPAFASPQFDDRAWRVVAPREALPGAHALRNPGPTHTWARLHLRVTGPPRPLAVAFTSVSVFPYAVYANGTLVAQSPGFAQSELQHAEPFSISLPAQSEVTLAVRFFCPRNQVMRSFPIVRVEVGGRASIGTSIALHRYQDFSETQIAQLISVALSLGNAVFAMTLLFAQRSRREYFWLAMLSMPNVLFTLMSVLVNFGYVPASPLWLLLYREAGCFANIALLEFVPLLTQIAPLRFIRPLQAMLVLLPAIAFFSDPLFSYSVLLAVASVVVVITVYIVKALLQRNVEALLLSFPLVLLLVATLLSFGNILFPAHVPFPGILYIGGLGLRAEQLPLWLAFLTVLAILQLRFVRVSQNEQQTAAELEAARVIQHLLIPDNLPEVAGFALGSVYSPALQVGGDFFQILPLASGALVVLGDVSGKGVPAAMTVALLVGSFRTLAQRTQSPAALLNALNGLLHGRTSGFTTCVVLHLEPALGQFVAASAGHLEPYLDGQTLPLVSNLPLGVSLDTEFDEQVFPFRSGQILTLLTDGVVEAFHPRTRELFGFERTQAVSHLPATRIGAVVSSFTAGAPPSDDITILSIAYTENRPELVR
jgi:hypothetical protein